MLIFIPAVPLAVSLLLSAIIGLSDTFLAAKLGTASLAAMGFCEPLWFMMTLLTGGLCSGIAVGVGARLDCDREKLQSFIVDSLSISGLLGLLIVAGGFLLSQFLFRHPQALSGTAPLVAQYFQWCAYSNLAFALMQAQCSIFRAAGRPNHVLILWGIAALLEISFSNLAMRAHDSGCPSWSGLEVFACGWNLGCGLAAAIGFVLLVPLLRGWSAKTYLRRALKTHLSAVWEILKVGMPVAAGELGVVCGGLINLQMLSMLPDATLFEAAWAVKARVEDALLVVPSCSIGMILTAFIARYFGGRSRKRARWAALIAIQASCVSFLVLIVGSVVVSLVSPVMVGQVVESSRLALCTVRILFMGCLSWPLFVLSTFCCAALEGTGKTLLPAALSLTFILPVRILLMWVFKATDFVTGSDIVTVAGAASYAMLALSLICLVRQELRRLL